MAVKKFSHDELYLGNDANTDKTLRFNQQGLGLDPFIRYNSSSNKFSFSNDGTSSGRADFVDAGALKPIIKTARCNQTPNPHTCVVGNSFQWWSTIAREAVGRTKINFLSSVFNGNSDDYSCYVTAINSGTGITCRVHGVHADWVDVQCLNAGANPADNANSNFFILCLFHEN